MATFSEFRHHPPAPAGVVHKQQVRHPASSEIPPLDVHVLKSSAWVATCPSDDIKLNSRCRLCVFSCRDQTTATRMVEHPLRPRSRGCSLPHQKKEESCRILSLRGLSRHNFCNVQSPKKDCCISAEGQTTTARSNGTLKSRAATRASNGTAAMPRSAAWKVRSTQSYFAGHPASRHAFRLGKGFASAARCFTSSATARNRRFADFWLPTTRTALTTRRWLSDRLIIESRWSRDSLITSGCPPAIAS